MFVFGKSDRCSRISPACPEYFEMENEVMEEEIIILPFNKYRELSDFLNGNPDKIIFKCDSLDKIMTVPIKNATPKESKEQNIVQKWMSEIMSLAGEGYRNTNSSMAERFFKQIYSYCQAVVTSVTS